jgi:hypothetical protein
VKCYGLCERSLITWIGTCSGHFDRIVSVHVWVFVCSRACEHLSSLIHFEVTDRFSRNIMREASHRKSSTIVFANFLALPNA